MDCAPNDPAVALERVSESNVDMVFHLVRVNCFGREFYMISAAQLGFSVIDKDPTTCVENLLNRGSCTLEHLFRNEKLVIASKLFGQGDRNHAIAQPNLRVERLLKLICSVDPHGS